MKFPKKKKNFTRTTTTTTTNNNNYQRPRFNDREKVQRFDDKKNSTSGGDGERPQKRFHDHHLSGTGRGKEFKKKGGGGHNWGKILIFQQIL